MKFLIISLLLIIIEEAGLAQKQINIWPNPAPGSENWTWQEQLDSSELTNDLLIYNVVNPSLTFFPANPAIATGTSVIICPGGSFCYLHINTEGIAVAKWLNKIGVSAFVLKYRLVHSETEKPIAEKNERMKDMGNWIKLVTPIVQMGMTDAKQAIYYVRKHATELNLDSNKIGIMGFSAGGTVAGASAFD